LYPHQEEALLEIMTGASVVVATPTGSGKTLISIGAIFAALASFRNGVGGRAFYTAPLKALVSEKFFELVELFGAENVGLMTGDSAINSEAPIITCTAEILANLALRMPPTFAAPPSTQISLAIMDEFHFYGDPDRGWAWQVPLLELPHAQFVLLSATLGDTEALRSSLEKRTSRAVVEVTSAKRPVPLEFEYAIDPISDTIERLVQQGKSPVYIVHFTQADAVERAQALMSLPLTSRAEKDALAAELSDFKFGTGFGKVLSRFVRAGVGVHHAGMLPKYRRLVERLTQRGLLKVVCGTDTLGVGINMPIRTVLFTGLVKFDGSRDRHLSAREFHQIAGRAGRAGFDILGEVLVMAPEHVIANRTALMKAGDDPKKLKKITRKQAPSGSVNWTEATYERLRDAAPEALTSQFRVTHAMVLNLLSRAQAGQDLLENDPLKAVIRMLEESQESPAQRRAHLRQLMRIYRSLRRSDIVQKIREPDISMPEGYRPTIKLSRDIPAEFALNQTLAPFALAAMDLLNLTSPDHGLDVVSVIEAVLEKPRQVLIAQEKSARTAAITAMKADGIEYDERMALLEEVTYPQPLADLLEPAFKMYVRTNPWVAGETLSPKSVVREMFETASTFTEYVSRYGLERSEGVLLRYLLDAYRAMRQVVPAEHRTQDVIEITEWLGEVVKGVDSSLLDEWEHLSEPSVEERGVASRLETTAATASLTVNPLALRAGLRSNMFRLVELAAREDYDGLAARTDWSADRWADALDPLFVEQGDDAISIDSSARSPKLLAIVPGSDALDAPEFQDAIASLSDEQTSRIEQLWLVRQVIDDADQNHDWSIIGYVDPEEYVNSETPKLMILNVGPM
jgi:superfamily II RNA helicase